MRRVRISKTRNFRTPTGKSRMLHNETDKAPKTWRFIGWLGMDEELGMAHYMDGFTEDSN